MATNRRMFRCFRRMFCSSRRRVLRWPSPAASAVQESMRCARARQSAICLKQRGKPRRCPPMRGSRWSAWNRDIFVRLWSLLFDASGLATPLADGDILRINSTVPAYRNTVTLRGNVANPGRFSLRPGMHLSDLIPDRESLVSRDYWWKRSHLGLPVPEFEATISTIGQDSRTLELSSKGFYCVRNPRDTDVSFNAEC